MFDLDVSKLAVIGAVALVVIGPEKMPRVARTIGTMLGKAQRYISDVKAEVNRSMELEDLKKNEGIYGHRDDRCAVECAQRHDAIEPRHCQFGPGRHIDREQPIRHVVATATT